jgi:Di-haem cytochrome c peroxidase
VTPTSASGHSKIRMRSPLLIASIAAAALLAVPPALYAFPVHGKQTVLPVGTELNEDALAQPREIFHSEAIGGAKSYLDNLGDLAFSSPQILGGVARQAGISCNTCHINGANNSRLYIPDSSGRPGTFDTTGSLFNGKADNHVLDAVTIPSLRGTRYLAPYGHDGRTASLRDFVRNVIVNEFSGPEPSPVVLDAIVVYLQDIDFLPNPSLGPGGRLTAQANAAERRGEALFAKPFPHDAALSCAGCHIPSAAFVDHQQHDVGSGGLYKTPTLLNADFNTPYFHDGRYDTYDQVVAHFDRLFGLGLSPQDQHDLVAYLTAVGDGERAYENDGVAAELKEANDFASVLGTAIPAHDTDIISLAVDTVGLELRELTEDFPERNDTTVSGGVQQRALARTALEELTLELRRIDMAAAAGHFDAAAVEYSNFRKLMASAVPAVLTAAQPWSLFNPTIHDAHYQALRQMLQAANGVQH